MLVRNWAARAQMAALMESRHTRPEEPTPVMRFRSYGDCGRSITSPSKSCRVAAP
jgi:hypothetical protein